MKHVHGPHRLGPIVVLAAALFVVAAALSHKALKSGAGSLLPDFVLAHWKDGLEHDGREVYDLRAQIVDAVGLAPGMTVADIGAGTGLFARLFARRVGPEGRVYATDVSRWAVFKATALARAEGLRNVKTLVSGETETGLPPESLDVVFLCDTYHHFAKPWSMLQSIHRTLKPGGRLVLVDYDRVPGKSPAWILEHVAARFDKTNVLADFHDAGFRLREEEPFLSENYLLVFQRP